MINKQLELNVNNEKILERIAQNLNVDFISDGSSIKKLADAYAAENLNFATSVDEAIANGFLLTMSSEFLEMFGRQNNIYRKNYKTISLYAANETVWLSINKVEAMITEISEPELLFNRGDVIYSDDDIIIESLDTIYIENINDVLPISVKITVSSDVDSYIIHEDNEYQVSSTNKYLTTSVPYLVLKFTRPVGLSMLQELESDYRMRIFEATYLANNGANSLISSITKEVPYLSFIETAEYEKGRAITTLYPYTKTLIEEGSDMYLDTLIIPLVETSLKGKVLHGQYISVLKPEPLNMRVNIVLKEDKVNNSYLENLKTSFNNYFCNIKEVTREEIESYILAELGLNRSSVVKMDLVFISPYVSEETFTLTSNQPVLEIPKGRFLYLNSITKSRVGEENVIIPE